jgi:hypothetical protein
MARDQKLKVAVIIGVIALVALVSLTTIQFISRLGEIFTVPYPDLPPGEVKIGGDYSLNGSADGDLAVVANSILISAISEISGDATLSAQNIVISGEISGDLNALGDQIVLDDGASVSGDAALTATVVSVMGEINGDLYVTAREFTLGDDAQVNGVIYPCGFQLNLDIAGASQPNIADCVPPPFTDRAATSAPNAFNAAMTAITNTLIAGGFAGLMAVILPRRMLVISSALLDHPKRSIASGMAFYAMGIGGFVLNLVILSVVPVLGVLMFILGLIPTIATLVLIALGFASAALVLGTAITALRGGRGSTPPVIAAVIGGLLIGGGLSLVGLLPAGDVISLLLLIAISAGGIGAAIFTRLGGHRHGYVPRHALDAPRTTFVQG